MPWKCVIFDIFSSFIRHYGSREWSWNQLFCIFLYGHMIILVRKVIFTTPTWNISKEISRKFEKWPKNGIFTAFSAIMDNFRSSHFWFFSCFFNFNLCLISFNWQSKKFKSIVKIMAVQVKHLHFWPHFCTIYAIFTAFSAIMGIF